MSVARRLGDCCVTHLFSFCHAVPAELFQCLKLFDTRDQLPESVQKLYKPRDGADGPDHLEALSQHLNRMMPLVAFQHAKVSRQSERAHDVEGEEVEQRVGVDGLTCRCDGRHTLLEQICKFNDLGLVLCHHWQDQHSLDWLSEKDEAHILDRELSTIPSSSHHVRGYPSCSSVQFRAD